MEPTTSQLTPAGQSPALALAPGSASSKRRFVTVVYEITDEAAWRAGGNPLNYEHHGLKSVCVSAGDLASLVEDIEAEVQEHDISPDIFNDMHAKHVMAYFPGR